MGRTFMTLVDHIWHRAVWQRFRPSRQGLGLVDDGLIAASDGRIVYAGPAAGCAVSARCQGSGPIATAAGSRRA